MTTFWFAGAALVAALLSLRAFSLQREQTRLLQGLRALIRVGRAPRGIEAELDRLLPLWRAALRLNETRQIAGRERQTTSHLLSAGKRFSELAGTGEDLLAELQRMLRGYLGPELVASAVLCPAGSSWQLMSHDGLPAKRIGELLIEAADQARAALEKRRAIYFQPERDTLCDLRVFGIGLSLFLSLKNSEGLVQLLWLGIAPQAFSLSAERRAFIQAIAEHAAATYYAAQTMSRREARAVEEKDFLLGLSHDLRAPGTSALYAVRDLLSGELGELSTEQHLRLSIIERAVDEQLNLLGDVLDFTRHQRGLLQARPTQLKLCDLIEPLAETFSLQAEHCGLSLVVDSVLPCALQVDPHHARRMLSNLLSNAIKYSDTGTVQLTFEMHNQSCTINVIDQGIGVPEQEREKLFGEFSRLENGLARTGSGLGLSLVRVLAELNGGEIMHRPNPEGGSIFSLRLPCAAEDQAALPNSPEPSVLVVDDDENSRRTNMRYLGGYARVVWSAESAEAAYAIALQEKPDVIVTDLHLKNHSALQFLEALHNQEVVIPTVIVSGSPGEQLNSVPPNVRLLQKPVMRSDLRGAIADLLAKFPHCALR